MTAATIVIRLDAWTTVSTLAREFWRPPVKGMVLLRMLMKRGTVAVRYPCGRWGARVARCGADTVVAAGGAAAARLRVGVMPRGRYAVTSTFVPRVVLVEFVVLEDELAALAPAEPLAAELLEVELLDAEALLAWLALLRAAISASTSAISEDTICSSVALELDFEASSLANSFSKEASCFCSEAIWAALPLELLEPTDESMMLSPRDAGGKMTALGAFNGGKTGCIRLKEVKLCKFRASRCPVPCRVRRPALGTHRNRSG